MYLAADYFRSKSGVGVNSHIMFCSAGGGIFGVKAYAEVLKDVVARYNIDTRYGHNLKEVRGEAKEAVFDVTTENGVEEVTLSFDMLHVAPPMSAPDFIKQSPLAVPNNPGGWVDVDKYTLRHNRYANVFAIGDASSAPTSRTAAAVRGEAPIVVNNLLAVMDQKTPTETYDGYTCCPLVTGRNYTIMAEFDYDGNPVSSFLINPAKERWSMWLVKKYLLPFLYWERMLKGAPFEGHMMKPIRRLLGRER
jgi:sulfide:quinone oxidoreductase